MRGSYHITRTLRYVRCAVAEGDVQLLRVLCGTAEMPSHQALCSRCEDSQMHIPNLKPLSEAAHR